MRVLVVHNYYQQPGGEDDVFQTECDLLASRGHQVTTYIRRNDEIRGYGALRRASLALRTTWAWDSHAEIRALLGRENPDLVHFHNTFPLISPAAFDACREAGVPVVQALHNPRLMCPGGTFYRDGKPCQDCMSKAIPWPGVMHACYRGSWAATATVAAMLTAHKAMGTYRSKVDAFITFSDFYKDIFLRAGLPPDRVFLKPHFVPSDPGVATEAGSYALFIGRLSEEKGASALRLAWNEVPDIPLRVRGEGDLLPEWQRFASEHSSVMLVSRLDSDSYFSLIRGARFLVWPSLGYYETFGRVAIESFACGVPVIGSKLGANGEMIRDGETGLHFDPASPEDLAAKVRWAWEHPAEMRAMGARARKEYETKYTADRNYELLIRIYESTLARRSSFVQAGGAH